MKKFVKKTPKPVRIPTAQYLENVALWYVQRFAATTATLTRVLQRRVQNAKRAYADFDPAPFPPIIETLVKKCVQLGYVNDTAFAENKTASLRRKGASARAINGKLREKGLSHSVAADEEDELAAARLYIKRKRLGQFRTRAVDNAAQKDMAALARAGFSGAVAKQVLKEEN
jgi:regulatory protein